MRHAAVALAVCAMVVVGCTSGGPGHRGLRARYQPAAGALLAFPDHLVDRPVASTGCGHGSAIRPGTTALLTVAIPPSSAAGAGRRNYWLHVPSRYDSNGRPVSPPTVRENRDGQWRRRNLRLRYLTATSRAAYSSSDSEICAAATLSSRCATVVDAELDRAAQHAHRLVRVFRVAPEQTSEGVLICAM